jgi:hypothetical protein
MASTQTLTREHTDLLQSLAGRRFFLRFTVRGLSDEQAGRRSVPASELCLGGLIKHVTATERAWASFIVRGAPAMPSADTVDFEARTAQFRMLPGETLQQVLADYADAAEETERIIAEHPDLDLTHPLPVAPWFEPGAAWSVRTVLLHLIGETAQHAGHADILREALDGAKTMG